MFQKENFISDIEMMDIEIVVTLNATIIRHLHMQCQPFLS